MAASPGDPQVDLDAEKELLPVQAKWSDLRLLDNLSLKLLKVIARSSAHMLADVEFLIRTRFEQKIQ